MATMNVSVVIPCLNEEGAIGSTVVSVLDALEAIDGKHEVIVVDDGSSDDTAGAAERAGATVIRNVQNRGYGSSLKRGISEATNDAIVITDGDGTYPVDQIKTMAEHFAKGYDLVVGARSGTYYVESALKMPLRLILRGLVEFVTGRGIPDINSGLRVFSRSSAMSIFPHLSDSFSFTTSMTLVYLLKQKSVFYLPIEYHERIGSTKVRLFRDSLRTMQFIVQTALHFNPLKIFLIISILAALFAITLIVCGWVVESSSLWGAGIAGIFVSMVIFALGCVGQLIRSHSEQLMEHLRTRDES